MATRPNLRGKAGVKTCYSALHVSTCNLDDFATNAIISELLLLDTQDSNKDCLFINSSGGSMSAVLGVFDANQLCCAFVSIIFFRFAASMAAIVLDSGSKGNHLAMPNVQIMLHQPMGGATGQAIDVEIQAKEITHHKTNLVLRCRALHELALLVGLGDRW
ncbi:hypothetical protein L7F22_016032 [Adiantum nelumboides]|nr:hypothetical protein [Adiantum nelumboides]